MKIGKIEFGPSQAIGLGMGILGLLQMVLSNKAQAYERKTMMEELKKDIMKDMNRP